MIIVAVAMTLAVWLWFRRTRYGRGLLAMAADREGAAMRGLPVGALALLAFAIGGAIAGHRRLRRWSRSPRPRRAWVSA